MCGRFSNTANLNAIQLRFDLDTGDVEFEPRYNIAPTQVVPVIIEAGGTRRLVMMRWGLIPSWAKDPAIGNRMINARAETLADKPSFKRPFQKRRCLIPADGFYEWKKTGKTKQPMRIVLKSRQLFGLAGLWENWQDPEGKEVKSFTIITTEPNELMKSIHNRMPVILKPESEKEWLDRDNEKIDQLQQLLLPFPAEELEAYPVSTIVNSPRNDSEECIKAVE